MPDFTHKAKDKLKGSYLIRDNYRRLRKIFLHLVHGRFYSALKLSNHYNPIYRLTVRNPIYSRWRQRRNLNRVLAEVYSYDGQVENKRYKVALIVRNGDFSPRSSSFIRLIGPLSDESIRSKLGLSILSAQNLPKNIEAEFVIVQRTAFDNVKQAQKLIRIMAASKLIVDNDDAFHEIDKKHPEYYEQVRRAEAVSYLQEKADEIWVSTAALVEKKFQAKTQVVINTLDPRLWRYTPRSDYKGPINLLYMGTMTHDADLEMIIPALDSIYQKFPGSFKLSVVGVSENLPGRPWIERLNTPYLGSLYPTFVRWFLKQGPFDVGLSPLVDSPFNRSKSDIKCLDYLAAGIIPLVSDILPYQSAELKGFIIKSRNDQRSWEDKLSKIIADPDSFRAEKVKRLKKAQAYIWQKRSSKNTALILLDRLQKLAN